MEDGVTIFEETIRTLRQFDGTTGVSVPISGDEGGLFRPGVPVGGDTFGNEPPPIPIS